MELRPVGALALLLMLSLSGCLTAYDEFEHFDSDAQYHNPGVFNGTYIMGNSGSLPLQPGILGHAELPDVIILESHRPAYGDLAVLGETTGSVNMLTGFGEEDESKANIVIAIWHPDNYTAKRPIIVDAGPYYEVDGEVIINATQSTPFLLQTMLPLGYSVAQIAVRGTGTAGGCMDLFGDDETADLDQALTWLGEQDWSNGNIAMMGVSYDGSTPWTAAGTGNPYLKTIVPISGLPDIYDLMLHNGSAETRAAIMHSKDVYWGNGFSSQFPQAPEAYAYTQNFIEAWSGQPMPWPVPPASSVPGVGSMGTATNREEYQDRQNLICPDAIEGQAAGQVAAREGSRMEEATAYWNERDHRQRVLDNYEGSIFLIHGLQDWNVDPHSAIPFNMRLREAGFELKEWYGQWGHQSPDSNCRDEGPSWIVTACRMDYADILSRWFDKYLRGNESADTGPPVQVQDNIGIWRNLDSFPPSDLQWAEFQIGMSGVLGDDATGAVLLPSPDGLDDVRALKVTTQTFPNGLHISGMPQVKVPFTVQQEGGFIAAWLFDVGPDDQVRAPTFAEVPITPGSDVTTWVPVGIPIIGHGQMNLRFYAGGEERQTLVPGERYVAQVELEPMDAHLPPGHRLMLWLMQLPYPEHTSSGTPADVVVHLDEEAVLRLPVHTLEPRDTFPVPGVAFPASPYIEAMYVDAPRIPDAEPADGPIIALATQAAGHVASRGPGGAIARAGYEDLPGHDLAASSGGDTASRDTTILACVRCSP